MLWLVREVTPHCSFFPPFSIVPRSSFSRSFFLTEILIIMEHRSLSQLHRRLLLDTILNSFNEVHIISICFKTGVNTWQFKSPYAPLRTRMYFSRRTCGCNQHNWLKEGSGQGYTVTSHTRYVHHLGRVCAQRLLNHFPLQTLALTVAQGLANHFPLRALVLTGAQGLVNHFPLQTLVLMGAEKLVNHFTLQTLVLRGAQGLVNHFPLQTLFLTGAQRLVNHFPLQTLFLQVHRDYWITCMNLPRYLRVRSGVFLWAVPTDLFHAFFTSVINPANLNFDLTLFMLSFRQK
jgi:hypothetical protein